MIEAGPYIKHVYGDGVSVILKSKYAGWLSFAIHTTIAWPKSDVALDYDGDWYILKGIDVEDGRQVNGPCLLVPYLSSKDRNEKIKSTFKFVSMLGWFEGGVVDIEDYIYGTRPILYSGKPILGVTTGFGEHSFCCNYMPIIPDENTRKALAYWREGMKLQYLHDGYSFLSFYKVIESQFKKGKSKGNWITAALTTLSDKAKERVDELAEQGVDVGSHIFKSGRCAIAHATDGEERVDPDSIDDKWRLSKDKYVIVALARKYIKEELGVPTALDLLSSRNALIPLRKYISPEHFNVLEAGGSVLKKKLGLKEKHVSVSIWPNDPIKGLEKLFLEVVRACDGIVQIEATTKDDMLTLTYYFDFKNKSVHTALNKSGFKASEISPELEISYLKYFRAVICNKTIELQLDSGEVLTCEVVIPTNVDIGRTLEGVEARINELTAISEA
ncbi:methylamine utilization protein MauJ [Vibrio cholerae]